MKEITDLFWQEANGLIFGPLCTKIFIYLFIYQLGKIQ